jgi:hypothetical protein
MSETVSVEKSVDVTVYEVLCECGEKLNFSVDVARDGDLCITVDEHECIQVEA